MEEALITAIVFTAIYQVIKVFTDFLLKKKVINSGHIDKAGILEVQRDNERNSYPTLKWGLVALFAGIGFIVIESMSQGKNAIWSHGVESLVPVGIELIAISLGFLTYFLIVQFSKK